MENTVCLVRVIKGPCADLFRDVLRHYIPEKDFQSKLMSKKECLPLNKPQHRILYPKGGFKGGYDDLDMSLLYRLIRNITDMTEHANGWGKEPDGNDLSISANIDRLRKIRNDYLGHTSQSSVSDSVFESVWTRIKDTVLKVAQQLRLSKDYERSIDNIRYQPMTTEGAMDPEACNIIANTKAILRNHTTSKTFIKTRQVNIVLERLQEKHIAILSGKGGEGKTTLAKEILSNLSRGEHPRDPVIIYEHYQWHKVINAEKKMVVHMDDIFGKSNIDFIAVRKWKAMFDVIESSAKQGNIYVILSTRQIILEEVRSSCDEHSLLDKVHEVNLSSKENGLTFEEREAMVAKFESQHTFSASAFKGEQFKEYVDAYGDHAVYKLSNCVKQKIISSNPYYGFPQTCFLFFQKAEFFELGVDFFLHPDRKLYENIENLRRSSEFHNRMSYCVLSYACVNGKIDVRNVEEELFTQICEKMNNMQWTYMNLKDAVRDLTGVYLVNTHEQYIYTFCHETVLEAVTISFGQLAPEIVIENCSEKTLQELIRTETYDARAEDVVLIISRNFYQLLADRLLKNFESDTELASWIMQHPLSDDPKFLCALFNVIKTFPGITDSFVSTLWELIRTVDKPVLCAVLLDCFGPHQGREQVKKLEKTTHIFTQEDVKERLHRLVYRGIRQSALNTLRYVIEHLEVDFFLKQYHCCRFPGFSILHCCLARGWIDAVDEILKVIPPDTTENEWSCVHIAAFFGQYRLLQKFENLGLNVLEITSEGYNALQILLLALRHIDTPKYFYLLESDGVEVNLRNLSIPKQDVIIQIIKYLLAKDPTLVENIDISLDKYNNNIIHYLILHNREDVYNMLVDLKMDLIFHRNASELPTTLHLALYLGRCNFAQKLWKAGVLPKEDDLSIKETIDLGKEFANKTLKHFKDPFAWTDQSNNRVDGVKLKVSRRQEVVFANRENYDKFECDFLS